MVEKLASKVFVRLPLEGVANCRDLGGYYSPSNRVTKWRVFLRSSHLKNMTNNDVEFLKNYGLRTIIDLRATYEIENNKNKIDVEQFFQYHNVDLIANNLRASEVARTEEGANDRLILGKMYVSILESGKEIKEVFDLIMNNIDKGGIMFHCAAGKDRTGIIAMLLLGLADVEKKDIVTNYEVSATNIQSMFPKNITDFLPNVLGSDPDNIIMAYDFIMENFGSFKNYFTHLGYSEADLNTFVKSYTE